MEKARRNAAYEVGREWWPNGSHLRGTLSFSKTLLHKGSGKIGTRALPRINLPKAARQLSRNAQNEIRNWPVDGEC